MIRLRTVIALMMSGVATTASAGETPLYQPAATWVVPAPLPVQAGQADGAPPLALLGVQHRIEDGQISSYFDTVSRIASAEILTHMTNIVFPWAPDKGDLIVHELSIIRGTERIDLVAKGQKFVVLRREQALEQRELTGILSATLAVEGLQVGDLLRVRVTKTSRDKALAGNVQTIDILPAAPFRIGRGQMRFSWPAKVAPAWKVLATDLLAKPVRKGDFVELAFPLPLAKQPEIPADAPPRFLRPPLFELSTFKDWASVSKTFAPLFSTEGAIVANGPLSQEVDKIIAAEPSSVGRAQRALQIVQDKIRYLAVGMDGGNYIPQSAIKTWDVRYGDCKAKTLLLLAMLHAMKIEAQPVLAHVGLGDLVSQRLPSAMAFNHVLVRATVDGETLWLDGTGSGTRLADIRDTPPFHTVLPVRADGAALMPIGTRANARPVIDYTLEIDESTTTDVPSVFDAKAVIRGPLAAQITRATTQFGDNERRDYAAKAFKSLFGEVQLSEASIRPNSDEGIVTVTARGVATTPWYNNDRQRKRGLSSSLYRTEFTPDRSRAAWSGIPTAATELWGTRFRLKLKLPDEGRDFTIEGEPDLKANIAGYAIDRSVRIADGVLLLDERFEGTGAEVPAPQIPAVRDAVATAKARLPVLAAPPETKRLWDVAGLDPKNATQLAAAEAIFTKAIANDPDEMTGYQSRASFRVGMGNRKGAVEDLTQAIKIEPTVELYLMRAGIAYQLGDLKSALADAQAARALDPSSSSAIENLARYLAVSGELEKAIVILDERIALGGKTKPGYQQSKADLLGEFGDITKAIALYDTLIVEKPGSPSLLNGRCWIKGIRNVMIDSALKDCTSAMELSDDTAPMLDSRALIWFRMGRNEDALRDLTTALASNPGVEQSRFLRGVVLTRMGKIDDAAKDLAVARFLDAGIDRTNARYGIKP
jgi:tetratricopeptide (TPR) repeat protein/transglutaminase-like putative cysteine protease